MLLTHTFQIIITNNISNNINNKEPLKGKPQQVAVLEEVIL
jgi:hypothetical protein